MKIKNIHPIYLILCISIIYFFLIFFNTNKDSHYGDFGIMYIQVQDIIGKNFSDFSIHYKGEFFDSEYKYFPYKAPFVGKVQSKFYLDFPPYFPFLNSIFYKYFHLHGLYFLNFISLCLSLYFIFKLGKIFDLENHLINLSLFLYSFCMTSSLYYQVFHEYPISILCITISFYFSSMYFKTPKNLYLFCFGFFGAISLYFRLEYIFVISGIGIGLLIVQPKYKFKIPLFSLLGFAIPFFTLLALNFHIHGHPLGLRYLLTITESNPSSFSNRIGIIYDLLFSSTRGFLYQSPFVLILVLVLFFRKKLIPKEIFLLLILSISTIFILIFSPNHGDHRAPRYLFGLFPIYTISTSIFYSSISIHLKSYTKSLFRIFSFNQILQFLFVLSISISLYSTLKNYKIMQASGTQVKKFNDTILEFTQTNPIIFRDYSQTLNAQKIYLNQMSFVIEKDENILPFIEKLRASGITKISISQVYFLELSSKDEIIKSYINIFNLTKSSDDIYFSNNAKFQFNFLPLNNKSSLLIINLDL